MHQVARYTGAAGVEGITDLGPGDPRSPTRERCYGDIQRKACQQGSMCSTRASRIVVLGQETTAASAEDSAQERAFAMEGFLSRDTQASRHLIFPSPHMPAIRVPARWPGQWPARWPALCFSRASSRAAANVHIQLSSIHIYYIVIYNHTVYSYITARS